MLEQLLCDEACYEEITGIPAGWLDSVYVRAGGIGQRERAFKLYKTVEGLRGKPYIKI